MKDKWYSILTELMVMKLNGVDFPLSLELKLEEFTKKIVEGEDE